MEDFNNFMHRHRRLLDELHNLKLDFERNLKEFKEFNRKASESLRESQNTLSEIRQADPDDMVRWH